MTLAVKRHASGLEGGVKCFGVLGGERHFYVLFAELFLDEGDGVVAWRQALDLELAIGTGHGEKRALGHVDEHAHPGMLVALDRKHDFFAGESFLERDGRRRLRLVPLAVVLGSGMNVVGGRIAVDDFDGLIGDYAQHGGMVFASALIEGNGLFSNNESAIAEALFD